MKKLLLKFKQTKIPIILGTVLALFVSLFLIGLIGDALSGSGQQIKFVSDKSIFQSNEQPTFRLVYKNKTNIFHRFTSGILSIFGASKNEAPEIKTRIFQSNGKEIDSIASEIKYENGKISLNLNHSHFQQEFKPGKYKLEIEVNDNGKIYTQSQEFVYGVLAINTNKSIYLPGEEAYLQIAVLDDSGRTICNSKIKLEIKDEKGKIQTLSTEDQTIKYSGECEGDNVTDVPDYFAHYKVEQVGKYEMKLTNLDNNYEIIDYFEVRDSVLFDVERTGPTRINPIAKYEMKIKIKANQDFKGEIVETVPMTFIAEEKLGAKQEPFIDNYTKTITWQTEIKKGETKEFIYTFDAPDFSPYFYLLGPLKIGDFEEAREWQIAADADKVIFLVNGVDSSPWNVPGDWTDVNTIVAIGGGGGGGSNANGGAGGGGGAYAARTNVDLTGDTQVAFSVGAAVAAETNGNPTWFCNNSLNCATADGTAVVVSASAGTRGLDETTAGIGGVTGAGGDYTEYAGGDGGLGSNAGSDGSGGGGGAGSPYGAGGTGGRNDIDTNGTEGSGGGGASGDGTGTNDNGTNGVAGATGGGGAGGDSYGNVDSGGAGGTSQGVGSPGTDGGGGGGADGDAGADGGTGGDGEEWIGNPTGGTKGCGGGGGGGDDATGGNGGDGGRYGGGAGGAATGGTGAAGLIVITYTPLTYTVSGTCKQYDQNTNSTEASPIKVAINGTPDANTASCSGGAWTLTLATNPTDSADVITVWVDNAANTNKAVAVTKWDGTGNIANVRLYERHLVIGSDDSAIVSNSELALYDSSNDPDIFFEATTTSLVVCAVSGCEDVEIYIAPDDTTTNTYYPNSAGSSYVKTHDIEIDGTFNMTGTNNYASISGSWDNDSVFTLGTSTLFFTASDSTEVVSESQGSTVTFNNVQFGDNATTSAKTGHWDLKGTSTPLDVDGNLTIGGGTLHGLKNITLAGNLTLSVDGDYLKDDYTFTFNKAGTQTWTDSRAAPADMGMVKISATTVTLGSSVKVNELTIDGSKVLDLASSGYTLTISGDGRTTARPLQNSGTLDCGTNSWVEYIASQSTDIEDVDYYNLKLASASTTFYITGNTATIVTSGSFNIDAGTFDGEDDTVMLKKIGTGAFSVSGTFTPNTSTFNYAGDGNTTIASGSYYNLQAGNITTNTANRAYTLQGNTTVTKLLTVGASSGIYTNFLDASTYTLTLSGTGTVFTVNSKGEFEFSTSTVVYTGNGNTTVNSTAHYYNLNIGTNNGSNIAYTADGNLVVNNQVNLQSADTGYTNTLALDVNDFTVGSASLDNSGTIAVSALSAITQSPAGTTTVKSKSGSANIGGAGTTTFYNFTLGTASDNLSYTFNLVGDIGASGSFTGSAGGAGTHTLGLSSYEFGVWGNFTVGASASISAGTSTANFNGTADTTYTNAGSVEFYNLKLNKSGADAVDDLNLASNLVVRNTLTITNGELIQSTYDVNAEGSTAVSVVIDGEWNNVSTGGLVLGGTFTNAGSVSFSAADVECGGGGGADTISITSTAAGQARTWTNTGTIFLYNLAAQDQADSAITCTSCTNTGESSTWKFENCPAVFTVSGTCQKADQAASCANSEAVKAAYDGALQTAVSAGSTNGGSWSIGLNPAPSSGQVITVFVDDVADNLEAVAVTKYDGTGDTLTGVVLYEEHLTIGSDDKQTLSDTNLSQYDNSVSTDEDIFFEASATSLNVCQIAGCEGAEIYILFDNIYQPNSGGSSYVETHDIEIDGTFDLSGSGNYASISGGWNNDGTFTYDTSTIFFMASDSTETVSASATNTFYNLQFGDSATDSYTGHWNQDPTIDVNNNLTIDAGTLHNTVNTNTTLAGNLSLGTNGAYTKGSGTFTFDGTSKTWTDSNTTKSDMGAVVINGGGTISLGSSVKATSINITASDTLDAASAYTLTLSGSGTAFTNDGTFTCSTGTVTYEGTAATTVAALNGANHYYNLIVGLSSDTNTFSYTAAEEIEASGSVTLVAGSLGVHTFNMSTYDLSVGGGANTGGIAVPAGTVFTQTSGTTKVYSVSGTATIGGAGTTKFYTFVIGNASDGATYTFNFGGDVGASDSFTLAAGTHTLGLSSYEFGVYSNFTVGTSASISAQTGTINFGGTADATYTNYGSCEPYNLIIKKTTGGADNLTLASAIIVRNLLTITDGTLVQGDNNVRVEGTSAVSVETNGEWRNIGDGDLTLGGTFANAGSVSFDTDDSGCTDVTDDILIRSTSAGVQKSWTTTAGTFTMYNIDVQDQAGTASITVYEGTGTDQNNGANWTFSSCGAPPTVESLFRIKGNLRIKGNTRLK